MHDRRSRGGGCGLGVAVGHGGLRGIGDVRLPNWPVWLSAIVLPNPGINKFAPSWVTAVRSTFGELDFQQNFLRPTGPKLKTLTTFFE